MPTLNESVHIVTYDPTWPDLFAKERLRIAAVLGLNNQDIEHIGSTAVKGLNAKPIIDMMLGVKHWPPEDSICQSLIQLGYESLGEAGVPERLYFRLRSERSFNLHVLLHNGKHWKNNLTLREYLRSSESARVRYSQTKQDALAAGTTTLLKYSEEKANMISKLLNEAQAK